MSNKICTKCKKRKSIDDYYKKGLGYRSECKECSRLLNRKKCSSCGKTKGRGQFYSYGNRCKACIKKYNKESRTIDCDVCGKKMYKSNGYTVCLECRQRDKKFEAVYCDADCRFWNRCCANVKKTIFNCEKYDWQPPCFVSSKQHKAYKKVYGQEAYAL